MPNQAVKAVEIEHLSVSYGQSPALRDITLSVNQGEYIGIIGPNGGGKSTLMKSILGLIHPEQGSVKIFGKPVSEVRGMAGYVPQFALFDKRFPITVQDAVLTGRIHRSRLFLHRYSTADREKADELLEIVGMLNLKNRQIGELSGGEFQKMLIARALATEPQILLLDEPTASVDAKSRDQIFSLLEKLNHSMTILLVTHDLLAVSSQVKQLACLNRELVYHGEPELNEHIVNTLYGCPVDLIAHGVPHRVLKGHNGEDCC